MCDDARDAEADLARAEAEGRHHEVKMRVTVEHTVTMPGNDHTADDLQEYIDEVRDHGETVDWEEV